MFFFTILLSDIQVAIMSRIGFTIQNLFLSFKSFKLQHHNRNKSLNTFVEKNAVFQFAIIIKHHVRKLHINVF